MRTLVFFLEEPSAKAMLEGWLPRILPANVMPRYVVFEGKQDLEKNLGRRLQGWLQPESSFLVLRDQDSGPCEEIKQRLTSICAKAGRPETIVRIACRELEGWYFGDLVAVEHGLELTGLFAHSAKAKYRDPDRIVNPSTELEALTRGRYQKVIGSRAIGPHLEVSRNTSHSFAVFYQGILRLLGK